MERYKKIGHAVYLTEKLFCKLHYITEFNYELDWQDLRSLRLSLIARVMGNYRFDLVDLSEAGLDQLIDFIQSEINRVKE
jgi:hypothetical protein